MTATRESRSGVAALDEARSRLASARSVLVLTGAGVSAESGVPTFRGGEGLWREFSLEDLATPEGFGRNPRLVWEWYAWRREQLAALLPNPAHFALAALERRIARYLLATQNVDGLHALAGSRRLLELHGSLWRVRCTACRRESEDRRVPLPELPPVCACGNLVRPGVVWFGEMLARDHVARAFEAAQQADVVLVVGTSSLVYPAAALPEAARSAGAFVVEVNPEETPLTALTDVSLRGKAGEIVPALVEERA